MVVLHYTGMADAEAAIARLADPAAEVSAHYVVTEAGETVAMVPEEARAWHAGVASWGGVADVNSRSIGIEIANGGHAFGLPPFPEPQMRAVERLLDGILARWTIPPERVVGHACVAPGRKRDPGEKFDWRRLALGGRAVWLDPEHPAPAGLGGGVRPGAISGAPAGGSAPAASRAGGARARAATLAARGADMSAATGASPVRPTAAAEACGPDAEPFTKTGAVGSGGLEAVADAAAFRQAARVFGYGIAEAGGWDAEALAVWAAFAGRFLPAHARAAPFAAGVAHLGRLAARWPAAREA